MCQDESSIVLKWKRSGLQHTTTDTIKSHILPTHSYLSKNSRYRI